MRPSILLPSILFFLLSFHLTAQGPPNDANMAEYEQLNQELATLYEKTEYAQAASVAERMLVLAVHLYGEDDPEYGTLLDNIGATLHRAGRYNEALAYLQRGIEHARVHLGTDHEDYVTRLNNLGMLYLDMGEYSKALNVLETVAGQAKTLFDEKNVYYSIIINNLALAYEAVGELNEALEQYRHALDLTEKSVGKAHYRYGIRLSNIAAIYRMLDQNDRAIATLWEALGILERTLGKENNYYILTLAQLGRSYSAAEDYDRALQVAREALALSERKLGRLHPDYLGNLCDIGSAQAKLGHFEEALQVYETAESLSGQIFGDAGLWRWASMLFIELARNHEALGNYPRAADYMIKTADQFIHETQTRFDQLNQLDQESYLDQWEGKFRVILSFCLKHPEMTALTEKAFDMTLVLKGLALDYRRNLLKAIPNTGDTALVRNFTTWKTLQETLNKQSGLPAAKRLSDLDDLKRKAQVLERQLASESAEFREARQSLGWQELQAALGEQEAAVEFFHFRLARAATDSTVYVAFVLRRHDVSPRLVYLFDEKKLSDLQAIRRMYGMAAANAAPALHDLLWTPLADVLDGISTLDYAPSGLLHRVNLGAVPVDARTTLAQRLRLYRMGSTRHLAIERKALRTAPVADAVVLGGIAYDPLPDVIQANSSPVPAERGSFRSLFSGGERWEYLEGTEREAEDVAAQLHESGANVVLRKGRAASEDEFKRLFGGNTSPAVVHLATHGFFFPDRDEKAKTGFIASDDPMVRCGLVLAGANGVWQGNAPLLPDREDGVLTASEIALLNFRNTELVVLSACDTGLGELRGNEGVYGLQRAFKMAGAHYVLMSLWPASDRQTHEFMSVFYRKWLHDKKEIPAAYQAAQNALMEKYALPFNPSLWAGFILVE